MQTEDKRKEFENSPRFRGMDFTRSAEAPEYYASPYANGAWDGWQASRESLVIELPIDVTGGHYRLAIEACKRRGIQAPANLGVAEAGRYGNGYGRGGIEMNEHSELKTAAEACKDLLPLRYMHSPGGSLSIRNDHGIVFGVHQNRSFPSMMDANKAHADLVLAATPDAVLALIAENDRLKSDNREMLEFKRHMVELREAHGFESWAAALVEVDKLRAENEALRSKLTTVHFVCDQIPGPDGCRFIELESPQGESLGDESGKWEIRPDGLAQLVVEIASPDVKRMAALLECAQGDLKQSMQIIERMTAERQEWQKVLKMTEIPREGDQSEYSLALKDAERYRWLRENHIFAHVQVEQGDGTQPYVYDSELDRSIDEIMAAMSKEVSP